MTDSDGKVRGDELARYFTSQSTGELAIDELITSAGDEWVVIRRGERFELIDVRSGRVIDLGNDVDVRADSLSHADHRGASFAPDAEHLLLLRRRQDRLVPELRSLGSTAQLELDLGPGQPWRASFDPTGTWLTFLMLTEDTNRNGRLDWPVPPRSSAVPCGTKRSFDVWQDRGDRIEPRVLRVSSPAPQNIPGLVLACGEIVLSRDPTQALYALHRGNRELWSDAACDARIVHADCKRGVVLVACTAKRPRRAPLELVGSGFRKSLGVDLAPFSEDMLPDPKPAPRFVPLLAGAAPVVIDFEARSIGTLAPGDLPVAAGDGAAAFRRGEQLVLRGASASETVFTPPLDPLGDVLQSGEMLFVPPLLVALDKAAIVGSSTRHVLAVTRTGRLLVASSDRQDSQLARGPLQWLSADPAE